MGNKMPTVSENNKMYGSLGVMKNSSVFSLQGHHLSMFDGCLMSETNFTNGQG